MTKLTSFVALCAALLLTARGSAQEGRGSTVSTARTPGIVEAIGTARDEVFYAATATYDGGVVAAGSIAISDTTTRLLVVKLDHCGDLVWKASFGNEGETVGRFVFELPSNDFIVGGYTNTLSELRDTRGLVIMKLSSAGARLWGTSIMDLSHDLDFFGYDAVLDSNNEIVVAGCTWRKSMNRMSVLLAKFDAAGNHMLTRSYYEILAPTFGHYGYSLIEALPVNGSPFYVVAGKRVRSAYDSEVLLIAVAPDMLLPLARWIGDSGHESVGLALAKTTEGFAVTGQTDVDGELFISKRDNNLNREWQKKMTAATSGYSILANHSGAFRLAGVSTGGYAGIAGFNSTGTACSWVPITSGEAYALAEVTDSGASYPLWLAGETAYWGGRDGLAAKCKADGTTCNTQLLVHQTCDDWQPAESDVVYPMSGWTPVVHPETWNPNAGDPALSVHIVCDTECALGACCVGEICTQTTREACAGTWMGANISCIPNPCLGTGACCHNDGTCTVTLQAACNGTWLGAGTTCSTPDPCPPLGACCAPGGGCTQTLEETCAGTWRGPDTDCVTEHCPVPGACCFDCEGAAGCTASNDVDCGLQGGRFQANVTCAAMSPACGQATGACCHDDGTCYITTCAACLPAEQACCFSEQCEMLTPADCAERGGVVKGSSCGPPNPCKPYCLGDLNCDGTPCSFADINPFVLYLSNPSNWALAYPGCNPKNGDINCDGTYPSFGDINPFVACVSMNPPPTCPRICPEPTPGPRAQGNVWGGPGTTCSDPNAPTYGCCTVVAGIPRENEPANCVSPDTFNGGCNSTPPVFSTLPTPLPATVYGESGTFGVYRDMDWYSYTSIAPLVFTVTVRAEFPPALYIVHAGSDSVCGPDPNDPDYWITDAPVAGAACTEVQLVTHCLPAGRYYFVVAPNTFSGVACGADYKLTVEGSSCGLCQLDPCTPAQQHHGELSACNDDPTHTDENAGCSQNPNNFEPLNVQPNVPYLVCGTTWANNGDCDTDWYSFTVSQQFSLKWAVETEVPIRASVLYGCGGDTDEDSTVPCGAIILPTCANYRYWHGTLYEPCLPGAWDHPSTLYPAGTYWFFVAPEDARGPLLYGYPCGVGNSSHAYKITLTAIVPCPDPCTDPAFDPTLQESEPTCGPGYVDVTDGGCDAGPPYHTKPIAALDLDHDYCGGSGAWQTDPNDPNTVHYDHDWYSFTTPATPAFGRWSIYLYAGFPAKWEIWPANNCAAGPIEGLEMPACYTTSVKPAQCYPANTTYWVRIAPTDTSPVCGSAKYYLALFNYGGCSMCSINCAGAIDNDDPCGDPDTNEGCDVYPVNPSHFLTFAVGSTYCGRSYASSGYYDPDWFKVNLAAVTSLRLRVQAEFPAFVGLYAAGSNFANPSCAAYDADTPVLPPTLLVAACSGTTPTNVNFPNLAAGAYVGVIYPIDYFGNLLTNYYPCGHLNQYKIIVTTYAP